MALRILVLSIMYLIFTPSVIADDVTRVEIGDELYVTEIQEGAFLITHEFPWPANALLVRMENGVFVLVDTPYTPQATEALIQWIEAQFGEHELTAINTGFHADSLGGNSVLIEQGIPVYGTELTVNMLEERGEATHQQTLEALQTLADQKYYEAQAGISFVPPDHLFEADEGLELEFEDEVVQVIYPGPGHTPDNLIVYFPERRLLFGGHLVVASDQFGNIADAVMDEWGNSVRQLKQFDAEIIVPAHGERLDTSLIEHTVQLIEAENHSK